MSPTVMLQSVLKFVKMAATGIEEMGKGCVMIFVGIAKAFCLTNEQQYDTIGQFWDEMAELYGLENLQGVGYEWKDRSIYYAIGLKNGCIKGHNLRLELPDDGWVVARGKTENLKQIYDEIYKDGVLQYEIETFDENGNCEISYYRKNTNQKQIAKC